MEPAHPFLAFTWRFAPLKGAAQAHFLSRLPDTPNTGNQYAETCNGFHWQVSALVAVMMPGPALKVLAARGSRRAT
jgi:hypothetical protein